MLQDVINKFGWRKAINLHQERYWLGYAVTKCKILRNQLKLLDTSIFLSSTACYISGIVRINPTVKLASISTLLIVDQNRCFQFFVNMFQRLMHRGVLLSRWWILHVYNLTGQLRSVGQMLLILTGWEYDTCQSFMLNIVVQNEIDYEGSKLAIVFQNFSICADLFFITIQTSLLSNIELVLIVK